MTASGRMRSLMRFWPGAAVLLSVALAAGGVRMAAWRERESAATLCETNGRRIATALLLYSQDHDGRLPPHELPWPGGGVRTWVGICRAYLIDQPITICSRVPAASFVDPATGRRLQCTYAINRRFYGVFAPGPFPLDNLEIAEQTALITESGRVRADGPIGPPGAARNLPDYWDTAWWPAATPSPHDGLTNVVAADGHLATVKPAYYASRGHDPLLGRLGGGIYNWNGGHRNGDTTGPPEE